jgi:ABC-2 type transport system permease protein
MAAPVSTPTLDIAPVREAGGSLAHELRGVRVIWRRELIRFFRNRTRILTSLMQPVLFLFVLGSGLSPVLPGGAGGVDFRTFVFPGVLAMTVLFTAFFSAVSIVWDREFGFLREMLVAPVHRSSLVVGKCLGGATVATVQGTIMLALAGLVHVPYAPLLFLRLLGMMALTAFTLTAFGTMIASRMTQIESFQVVMQLIVLPMFFLSGAVFPLGGLPTWLSTLTKIDPLTYAVDPMRRAVFDVVKVPASTHALLHPGLFWNGWLLPTLLELAIVAALGAAMLWAAIIQFSRPE